MHRIQRTHVTSVLLALLVVMAGLAAAAPNDLDSAIQDSQFSLTECDFCRGIEFSDDGTRMYVADRSDGEIDQYYLSTPYEVETADYFGVTLSVDPPVPVPEGLEFSDDGSKLFVIGTNSTTGVIAEYELDNAWSVQDATLIDNVSAHTSSPTDVGFDDDGDRLFESSNSDQTVYTHTLTAGPYDLTNIFRNTSRVTVGTTTLSGIDFSHTGSELFYSDSGSNHRILQSNLSDPYNLTSVTTTTSISAQGSPEDVELVKDGARMYELDDAGDIVYQYDMGYDLTGTIQDINGNPIEGATVEVSGEPNQTTAASGEYSYLVTNGTYEVTASADGYVSNTTTVTVAGENVVHNITLVKEGGLRLEVNPYMDHGSTQPYEVWEVNENASDVNVTENSTVTSSDFTVVTVNQVNHTLISTGDVSVNKRVQVTATYNNSSDTRNVTVANLTVGNIKILPPEYRIAATIGDPDRVGGTQLTVLVLIIATLVAVVGKYGMSAFGGLSAGFLVLVIGFFGGWISLGLLLVALFLSIFLGLNLAANIDYQVKR